MTVQVTDFNHSTVFEDDSFADHEQIVFCHDKRSGLKAIIALHSTVLGPAMGGTRMWKYGSSHQALTDVLRLSKGMTYKNALAGIPFGGGKAVIIGDSKTDKSEALFTAFGAYVEGLSGRYITAEDVGVSADDMETVSRATRFARGTRASGLGDPSPYTALGVYAGILATIEAGGENAQLSNQPGLRGMRFAVQGLGAVGYGVAEHLHKAGGHLIVADVNEAAIEKAVSNLGAEVAPVEGIHAVDCDVFVPCALGAGLNQTTIPQIRAKMIAGAANNQLAVPADGVRLQERGILYAPDYVINAGGVISIALARPGGDDENVVERVHNIGKTLTRIYKEARRTGTPPALIADRMAERIVAETERR